MIVLFIFLYLYLFISFLSFSIPYSFPPLYTGGGYYTIKDIVFFLSHMNAHSSEQDYRRKCTVSGAVPVTLKDKKDLEQYLSGETQGCDQLVDSGTGGGLGLGLGLMDSGSGSAHTVVGAGPQWYIITVHC